MHDKLTVTIIAALVVLSAGSAFALATGAHEDVAADSTIASGANLQQQSDMVLVFADDYTPETSFEVITRLKQGAVREILGQSVNDRPLIENTADYSGYLVRLQSSDDVPGEYGLVFVHRETGRLMLGSQYQFTADSTFFRVDANLLQTGISSVDGDTTTEEATPTPENGTTTPDDGTPTAEAETPTPTPTPTPTMTPEEETPTPTPEAADETPTPAEAGGDGLISGIADFLGGLFDGEGDEGGQQTTTVDGGGAS